LTLSEARERVRTRLDVDLEAEVDLDSPDDFTEEFNVALAEVARATYFLWTWRSNLTLVADDPDYDLTAVGVCSEPVFDCYGVHVNGVWLEEQEPETFFQDRPNYFSESSATRPAVWIRMTDAQVRIAPPPNAAAVAASDNFVIGFAEPLPYTWSSESRGKDTQLPGTKVIHQMIVDRLALNLSVSYAFSEEGYRRRGLFEKEYVRRAERFESRNLAKAKPLRRKAGGGSVRRIYQLGDP